MSEAIRLYMFDGGSIQGRLQGVKLNQGLGEPFTFPISWFVLTHPDGNVVIDGGNAAEVAVDPVAHWGSEAAPLTVMMSPEQAVVPSLERAGFDLSSIRWVVQTHLHMDHTGAVAAIDHFPNARVLVTRTEFEYAQAPDWFTSGAYIRADFVKPGIDWDLLGPDEDGYDLFGDGTLVVWNTPGHSPGHVSFEITLPSGRKFLLAGDAANTRDHWEERALPGLLTSAIEAARSVRKLRRLAWKGEHTIVMGHDPDEWPTLKHAPLFYD